MPHNPPVESNSINMFQTIAQHFKALRMSLSERGVKVFFMSFGNSAQERLHTHNDSSPISTSPSPDSELFVDDEWNEIVERSTKNFIAELERGNREVNNYYQNAEKARAGDDSREPNSIGEGRKQG